MLKIADCMLSSIGRKKASLICTVDLSAAFDTVSHGILLERLKSDFGISGTPWSWLQSYVTGRTQHVKVGDTIGPVTNIHSGVPQGSVLGPTLFAAYMAPISRIIDSHQVGQHTMLMIQPCMSNSRLQQIYHQLASNHASNSLCHGVCTTICRSIRTKQKQ